ncbi:hypothetical protein [Dickeya chrysanthemi]|uniref:hypothetical protein n=1 Tax=Dickeya chrysanthemi TaxID=556 RepID=UPI0005870626|nr:hypothetical protein [Dickeya chrysanthemi]
MSIFLNFNALMILAMLISAHEILCFTAGRFGYHPMIGNARPAWLSLVCRLHDNGVFKAGKQEGRPYSSSALETIEFGDGGDVAIDANRDLRGW